MVRCPECGSEANKSLKEWNYFIFHVINTECEKCGYTFKAYYKDGKLSHIIENGEYEPQRSILKYLKKHNGSVGTEEISKALHIPLEDVILGLAKLEQKGKITSSIDKQLS
jgi:hypothetical protein